MSGNSFGFTARLRNIKGYYLARLRERLWLKPLISCLLSLFAAFVAGFADRIEITPSLPDINSESIEELLNTLSASMLVIAVFTVGAMVSAYAAASSSATPRSFPLVIGDDVSQNALSTFIGAFIFSIVAQVSLLNGFYGPGGRFVLFLLTIFVFSVVILGFVRWVDRIARLGRVGNTIEKVECATDRALMARARFPTLGACAASSTAAGIAVYSQSIGYVQNIDVARLQKIAEQSNCHIDVCVLPGAFLSPDRPLAYIRRDTEEETPANKAGIIAAFVIARDRTFESDPRFGLIVLSEIASRALSPAVNDPGTAIQIIGAFVRLFVRWSDARRGAEDTKVEFDRVAIPALSIEDLFDDAFSSIARQGAKSIEVGIRLQKSLSSLAQSGSEEMTQVARQQARKAFDLASHYLETAQELETLSAVADRHKNCETNNNART